MPRKRAFDQINRDYMSLPAQHMSSQLYARARDLLANGADIATVQKELNSMIDAYQATLPEMMVRDAIGHAIDHLAREKNDLSIV